MSGTVAQAQDGEESEGSWHFTRVENRDSYYLRSFYGEWN